MSFSMDSLPEPTECQGQRDHYVTGSFWWLWSLTGELVDGFAVSITQSLFKGNLKRAQALVALRFMTGHCWWGLKQEGFTYSFIQIFMSRLSRPGSWWQAKCHFISPNNFLQLLLQECRIPKSSKCQLGDVALSEYPGSALGCFPKGKRHPY